MSKSLKLVISIITPLLIGFVGSLATTPSIPTWYAGLVKPVFSPPSWIFAPVWTLLYILMGMSFYLIWIKRPKNKKADRAMKIFGIQLALNAIWSPIFFGARSPMIALVVIALMWIFIRKTIIAFAEIDRRAAFLLYPYLVWVSFATILNFSVWILNI